MYTVQYSMNLRDARRGASYFRNLTTAREVSRRHGLPFWNIVAGHQLRPYAVPPSFANLLLQANTTLAAGGRSVAWYQYGLPCAPAPTCYAQAAADAHGCLAPTWRWLQEVNRQDTVRRGPATVADPRRGAPPAAVPPAAVRSCPVVAGGDSPLAERTNP